MKATITLREYLNKGKTFVVPNYQRGYVWGKANIGKSRDAVTYMMDSLISAYNTKSSVFIQGVTVSELYDQINLIDGQQRTTFFYLFLKTLEYKGRFNIRYEIREKSNEFLAKENLLLDIEDNPDESYQDIYYFKKTLRIVREKIANLDIEEFREYVLDNVKFLYIDIPEDKATKVFSMMNGNKAEMRAEELIKAELLRLASLNQIGSQISDRHMYALEWDNNMLRSRYAREWDKWLQWWNRKDVSDFYQTTQVMGLLVSTCLYKVSTVPLTFESFKQEYLNKQTPKEAKQIFDKLRRLQKRFEDAFNTPKIHNWVGAILRIADRKDDKEGKDDRDKFIKWYFLGDKPSNDELEKYYKYAFLGMTYKEITGGSESKVIDENTDEFSKAFSVKYPRMEMILMGNNLYNENPEEAFKLLLRLNIDEDNNQNIGDNNKKEEGKGRNFDFSIWDNKNRGRSLEHIYPKSKVYHIETLEDGTVTYWDGADNQIENDPTKKPEYIDRASCVSGSEVASEHSIGNLVLLYKDDNSAFNDSSPEEKKQMFFMGPNEKNPKEIFKSRHLLHTIYKFAHSQWKGKEIAENKIQTLEKFREYYEK